MIGLELVGFVVYVKVGDRLGTLRRGWGWGGEQFVEC